LKFSTQGIIPRPCRGTRAGVYEPHGRQPRGVAGENRIVADVVDLVLARDGGGRVSAAQNDIGGGAAGRRRAGRDCQEETMVAAAAVGLVSDDLTGVVDPASGGAERGPGLVEMGVSDVAVEEAVPLASLYPPTTWGAPPFVSDQ